MEEDVKKDKVVILTVNNDSYLPRSLKTALEEKGVTVAFYVLNDINLYEIRDTGCILFLFAEEYDSLSKLFMANLRQTIIENQYKLVLIGEESSIKNLKMSVNEQAILDEFYRPIDIKRIVDKMDNIQKKKNVETIFKKSILVVDDSGVMLRMISKWLGEKYNVSLANSAFTADVQIKKHKPDMILLDYEMPEVSGAEYCMRLRGNPVTAEIPIVFLTSKSDTATVRQVLSLGPKGYLLKTTPSEKLVEKIDAFMAQQA